MRLFNSYIRERFLNCETMKKITRHVLHNGYENTEFLIVHQWNVAAQQKTNTAESAFRIFTLMGVIGTI
jgi:hypothetical protein